VTEAEPTSRTAHAAPLVVVLAEPGGTVPRAWFDQLTGWLPGARVLCTGDPAPDGVELIETARGPWWQWLPSLPEPAMDHGVVILSAGLTLPDRFADRLHHIFASADCPPLLTLPGNHDAALNPLSGVEGLPDSRVLDSLILAAAELRWAPIRHAPEGFALIAPGRVDDACRQAGSHQCMVYDGGWVHDPGRKPESGNEPRPDVRAALGHLRRGVTELLVEGHSRPLPLFGFERRPVVLHISHDWGGGVARWITDIIAADRGHDHLVLSAGGRTDGKVHGQYLKLYAAGPGRACIRRWTLSPAIAGTVIGHAHHRAILAGLIERYAIDRVVVSSLIGHALDALDTGLPTLQVLHDFYPAWPVLDRDPFDYRGTGGRIDLDQAIADNRDGFLFADTDASRWRELASEWLRQVREQGIPLLAPTRQVMERWQALTGDPLGHARVIGHGFAGWPEGTPAVEPRPLADGRLNLVVVGRLSPGKGLGLLEQALPRLRPHARITLLGCGHHGMRFFGQPGVDIVLDYRREELPRHLARIGAQAVLFLSTVAETWNYVLTETRTLGLVPLATRTGSFIERIDDGRDGLLFAPEPDALAAAVAALASDPGRLESLRAGLPAQPDSSAQLSMLEQLASGPAKSPAMPRLASASDTHSHARDALLADQGIEITDLQAQRDRLRADLAERTEWARRHERLSRERTAWARRLDAQLERDRQAHQSELAERTRWARSLEQELELIRTRNVHLESELAAVFASRSWRLTRPMRVINRVAVNALRRRIYNPMRWPRLLGRLVHNLRLYGMRGTLGMMQQGQASAPEPSSAVPDVVTEPATIADPVGFSAPARPRASIVVPVYNNLPYTAACLASIAEHGGSESFEVIVVDDCSSDGTAEHLAACHGLTVIRNRDNSGFIASCNRGAQAARGEFLVFLNNDTTLTDGWLDALLATFTQFPDAGIAGARLVYPDGRLQEAGGIVFRDGSGWNYGRGDEPDRPDYAFACEADYVSGACLAIRRDAFLQLGGFDNHYAPAYYEDTDLCFRMRSIGKRVIYQPACTVIHHEGISSGTDESSGTKRYQAVNREKFVERWRDRLAEQPDPVPGPEAVTAIRRARHHRSRGRVLVIDAVTPEPDKDSGSMRMVAMLEILRDMGYQVAFMPENLAWTTPYTRDLQMRGIEMLHHPWVSDRDDWLDHNGSGLDLVIVSRHYVLTPLLPLLRRCCRKASIVFDTVDLHFLREERMAELTGDAGAGRMARRTRRAELDLIRHCDATLVVSPVEKRLLEEIEPKARIRVLSNIHRIHGRSRDWAERRDLMFVGGFQHPPNVDAAEWLIDEIMPRVLSRLPGVRLHVIGSRMPEKLRERRAEGVVLHGYVEDLTPYLEGSRLSLAPLRYGAGVKGKVNQAMAWGLPVVATGCAAEGMYLEHGQDVLIADDAEAFAAAIVHAYQDEALWTKLSNGGLQNVERHFSFDAASRAIAELIESLRV